MENLKFTNSIQQQSQDPLIDKIWTILDSKNTGQVNLCNLRHFIAAIMGIQDSPLQENLMDSQTQYGEYSENDKFIISHAQFVRIQKDFNSLSLSRKSYNQNKKQVEIKTPTFRPQICKNTGKLIEHRRSQERSNSNSRDSKMYATFSDMTENVSKPQININLYVFIFTKTRINKKKEQNRDEMKECSFKPIINNYIHYDKRNLYNLHKKNSLGCGKTIDQCEFEKNKKEYTFTPKVNKEIIKGQSSTKDKFKKIR